MERVREIQKIQITIGLSEILAFGILFLSAIFLNSCTTYQKVKPDSFVVPLSTAEAEVAEDELLDVRIKVFNPGKLPSSKNESLGLSEKIREAEALFIPVQLKKTIQKTGCWGAVRVGPEESSGDEVIVSGTILESNGEELRLKVDVHDATGKQWFKREYKCVVSDTGYEKTMENDSEAFQNIYNRISNDLLEYRKTMTAEQALEIRRIAEMKFAQELAPDAFSGYLKEGKRNKIMVIDRLPSEDDQMLSRVRRLRERDYMLIDTLDTHYENLHHEMNEAYTNWRKTRLNEINLIREVDSSKNKQRAKGVLMILAGAIAGAVMDNNNASNTATAVVVGAAAASGISAIARAEQIAQESQVNKAALEELGISFEAEVEPFVVDLEGETVELTGSAGEIMGKWRQALAKLYRIETGYNENNTPDSVN
ncbi:MAG: hypothetical protein PVG39_05510 [Desulfobacteraceae bacterium]|jgi:hypothetical protein